MNQYQVNLYDIVWDFMTDDYDPEYHEMPTDIPNDFYAEVEAEDEEDAVYVALDHATNEYGWCIQDSRPEVKFLGTTQEVLQKRVVEAYEAMKRYGGGFMSALAEALVKADMKNAKEILNNYTWSGEIEHLVRMNGGK